MKYYLGVDGGASKTEALILNENAEVVGVGRSGPGNYEVLPIEEIKKNWLSAIEKAKPEKRDIKFEKACFGLSGADFPPDFEMLNKEIYPLNIAQEIVVENDTAIALRAGSKDYWGIVVIMGAGTNGYGKTKDGVSYRFYGKGYESGDWGGSHYAIQDVLHYIFRSYDGRGEKTVLEDRILKYFGEKTHDDLAQRLYYHPDEKRKALDFAPNIFKAIEEEDKVAIKIGERIVEETVKDIKALMKKLNLMKENTPVILCGSLFKGASWVPEYISAKTHMFAPKATVSLLKTPPAIGAALIAWEAPDRPVTEDIWNRLSNFSINKK